MDWMGNAPLLGAGLVLGFGLVAGLAQSARAGFLVVLFTYLLDDWLASLPFSAGVLIYPQDLVLGLLLLAGLVRHLRRMGPPGRARLIPLGLLALFAASLLRGIGLYGAKLAGVECRPTFYFLAALLYFSTFTYDQRLQKSLITSWVAASSLLAALALLRWGFGPEVLRSGSQPADPVFDFRVLNSADAMFLAIAFFASLTLSLAQRGPLWQRAALYLLAPIIVLLQHRTVWAVILAGLAWLISHRMPKGKAFLRAALVMAGAGALVAILVFGGSDEIRSSVERSATDPGTLLWRIDGWQQLLWENSQRTSASDLLGQPYGAGFERTYGAALVVSAPHNYYVESFLRLGLTGLALLLLLYVGGVRRLSRLSRNSGYPDKRFWSTVLIVQLVFFITYSPGYPLAALTAVAAGMSRGAHRKRRCCCLRPAFGG